MAPRSFPPIQARRTTWTFLSESARIDDGFRVRARYPTDYAVPSCAAASRSATRQERPARGDVEDVRGCDRVDLRFPPSDDDTRDHDRVLDSGDQRDACKDRSPRHAGPRTTRLRICSA